MWDDLPITEEDGNPLEKWATRQTRTLVHSFNLDSVLPKAQDGLGKADLVIENSEALIEEYHFRRQGLGLATMFITLLVIGLWIKIKRIGV